MPTRNHRARGQALLGGLWLALFLSCAKPTEGSLTPVTTPLPVALTPEAKTEAPLADLPPGPLQTRSGAPVLPGQQVIGLQGDVGHGSFLLGLRPDLAPRSVARVMQLVRADAFLGQDLQVHDGFLILPATRRRSESPTLSEPSRVAPAPGLLYFDGVDRLGLSLDGRNVPETWICVGQLQVAGTLLSSWRERPAQHVRIHYLGDMRS